MRSTEAPATCLICGKLLPKGCSQSRRYCDACAAERNREQTRERMRKLNARRYIVLQEKQETKDRRFCRECRYYGSESYGRNLCDYLLQTGHMRGCPYGVGCTKRVIR